MSDICMDVSQMTLIFHVVNEFLSLTDQKLSCHASRDKLFTNKPININNFSN